MNPKEDTDTMYEKILNDPLRFGEEFSPEACSILTSLLNRDPSHRLGVKGADEIKRHPFFHKHIDFRHLAAKKIQPPFKPSVASPVVRSFLTFIPCGFLNYCRMSPTLIWSLLKRHPLTVMLRIPTCRRQSKPNSTVDTRNHLLFYLSHLTSY
jgi:serine/threonine protein kinase